MKKVILFVLLLCTFANTMVPRHRRALPIEEIQGKMQSETTTTLAPSTTSVKRICASKTPCAWSVYKPVEKYIEMTITNSYCECDVGTRCQLSNDDSSVGAYVHYCREPSNSESLEHD